MNAGQIRRARDPELTARVGDLTRTRDSFGPDGRPIGLEPVEREELTALLAELERRGTKVEA